MIDSLGFRPETFIGMFIPNTYEFYWTSSPESVIKRFKKEYDTFWNGRRDRLAKEIGLDRNEVMTLASIVIGETLSRDCAVSCTATCRSTPPTTPTE